MISSCVLSHLPVVSDSATLWTEAHQAPLSMGFSRQEYCSGLPFPSPGDLPNPGIESTSHVSCTGRRVLYHKCHLGNPMSLYSPAVQILEKVEILENVLRRRKLFWSLVSFHPEKGGDLLTVYNDTPLDICMSTPFTNYKKRVVI